MVQALARLLVGILLLTAEAGSAAAQWLPEGGWQAVHGRNHPLAGAIVDARAGQPLTASALKARVAAARIVLLGEVHDNPDHHRLRAQLLTGKASAVFEHLRPAQQPVLDTLDRDRADGRPGPTVTQLLEQLAWSKSGWPDGQMFEPLFAALLASKAVIVAGDAAPDRIRDLARRGTSALPPDEAKALSLDHPLEKPLAEALLGELEASHCGVMPARAFEGMAVAQRYRDAVLADRLIEAAARHDSTVLLAGNGHVRRDRGVPWYLAARGAKPPFVVMFVEVTDRADTPDQYIETGPDGLPLADVVVITPRAEREDPCASLRRSGAIKK